MARIWYTVIGSEQRFQASVPSIEAFSQLVEKGRVIPIDLEPGKEGGLQTSTLLNTANVVHFGLYEEPKPGPGPRIRSLGRD